MTPKEYQSHVNLVQDRHHNLNLTYEQAEAIYQHELEKNTYSDNHFFSAWEEWDYEQTAFREILNEEQLKAYENYLNDNIQRYEQNLVEQDKRKTSEIAYHEALASFYEIRFLPDIFKDPFLLFDGLTTDRAKIEYIKTEYKRFLNDTKKAILTSHFRHNRTFKPNELKASLVRHKLLYMFPDYISFKHQMDEPTRAVAHYLKIEIRHLPDKTEELLTRKFNELKEFNDTNFKKHYGEIRGWHVVDRQLTPEEEKEHRTLTLLLLDQEKYGC